MRDAAAGVAIERLNERASIGRQRDERAVGYWLVRAQLPVQRHRRAVSLAVEAIGVVDLVGFAVADRLVNARYRLRERGPVDARLQGHCTGGVGRAGLRGEPGIDRVARQVRQPLEHQNAQRRRVVGREPRVPRLQQLCAPFVVGQQHRVQAGAQVGIDARPHRIELRRLKAAVHANVVLVEPAARALIRGSTVVEQREGCRVHESGSQLQSSMSCLILWRFAISSSTDGSLFSARRIASLVAS